MIPLPRDEELPKENVELLANAPPLNVTRMFAASEDMFPGIVALVRAMFTSRDIEPRLREMIILRTAHLLDCTYEWQANIIFAKNVGLSDEQIALVGADGAVIGLDPIGDLICRATDEITKEAVISDNTLAKLKSQFGPKIALKYIVEMSWFNMLSRFILSTRVPLETDTAMLEGRTVPSYNFTILWQL